MIADELTAILFSSLIALFANWIAWRKGFYQWSPAPAPEISFKNVAVVFAIFVVIERFIAPFIVGSLVKAFQIPLDNLNAIILNFCISLSILILILYYSKKALQTAFTSIWKSKTTFSPLHNFGIGILTLFLAFPVVIAVGEFFDLILYTIYQLESYEQVAVKILRTSLASPLTTFFALLTIIGIAPILEEFLFRGTLQTYLKKRVGPKAAIIIASAVFACFHFAPEQGLGNLSLLPSLFTFACFLGFIYERQGSLFASIGLHFAFNLLNCIRIIASPETS